MLWSSRVRLLRTAIFAIFVALCVLLLVVFLTARSRTVYTPEELQPWYMPLTEKDHE